MVGVSVLVFVLALDNELGRPEGVLLVALLVVYVAWTVITARRGDAPDVEAEYDDALDPDALRRTPVAIDVGLVVIGLGLLVVGAQLLVSAATDIAVELGVSDLVIGLTVVAVGTSLPEIATSVLAAARGQRDLAVGNAIGSNIFNLLAVLGLTAIVSSSPLPVLDGALSIDLPVMIGVAIACLPIFANGFELKRWEGAMFVAFYAAYVTWLVLDANDHELRDAFAVAMTAFVLPLAAVTLVVVGWRSRRSFVGST
jgi:cation:H+ antiporter